MNYAAAIEALHQLAPELHTRAGEPRRKFSLDEMRALLCELSDPQTAFRSVLIAGTNGKGSTAATLTSILTESGVKTGLYTSPHLERPNERIRVNAAEISDEDFAAYFSQVQAAAQKLVETGVLPKPPSFFEVLTAMAFLDFKQQGVAVAVLEVGLGGRLDATNVVEPLLSVITDISLDHTEWLGSTLSAIAREKAGILRPSGALVTLPQQAAVNQTLGEVALELNVRGVSATAYMPPIGSSSTEAYEVLALGAAVKVDSPLRGAHQHRNLALAIATVCELAEAHDLPITAASIEKGIHSTQWPGRLERIAARGRNWLLDVAHNPAGVWALRAGVHEGFADAQPKVLVFGCLKDKPLEEMAQVLFPIFDAVFLVQVQSPRATPLAELIVACEKLGVAAVGCHTVEEALQRAAERAQEGILVVSGSVYLVGEARARLLGKEEGQF